MLLSNGTFSLIFWHLYLTATSLMIIVFARVVTSGDNILFGIVQSVHWRGGLRHQLRA